MDSTGVFRACGFAIAIFAVCEYFAIQFSQFRFKVEKEVEVRKENIAAKAESKKQRLAKKRDVKDVINNKKLDLELEKTKAKANEKFGEEIFENASAVASKEQKESEKKIEAEKETAESDSE